MVYVIGIYVLRASLAIKMFYPSINSAQYSKSYEERSFIMQAILKPLCTENNHYLYQINASSNIYIYIISANLACWDIV